VIALAHAGGSCRNFENPDDLSSCEREEEIITVANALPEGTIDAIVAGHTHRAMAHVVHGIPVLESYANGRAFGRIDFVMDTVTKHITSRHISPPHELCGHGGREEPDPSQCHPEPYEGSSVVAEPTITATIAPALEAAASVRARLLGVQVETPVRTHYRDESALTNLVADMMRTAVPDATVAIMNAGGVRTDLPAGALNYGTLYSVLPFDNRLVSVQMRGRDLAAIFASNASASSGALGVSGVHIVVACEGSHAVAHITRDHGNVIADDEIVTVVTNDYLAVGTLARHLVAPLTDDAIATSPILRDVVATRLAELQILRGTDVRWFDASQPRIMLPGERPLRCH
jgi:5'-nucleotidase